MKKTKKVLAFVLAASMVMGNAVVAFAEGEGTTTTGTTTGTGSKEGHVEKKATNVILPTVEAGKSFFSYTMDPERLIQGTKAAKYGEGSTFPKADEDTGVYFLTGDKTYKNTSNAYKVINKSSCDVVLSVKVKAVPSTDASKDIGLVGKNALTAATDAKLYLGLKLGEAASELTEVSTTETEIKRVIAGQPNNFEIGVDSNNAYVYREKPDASAWKAVNISLTGEVTSGKPIASDTTAPAVQVTWSWAEKATTDTGIDNAETVDYVDGPQITVSASGLMTVTNVTAERNFKSIYVTVGSETHDVTVNPVEWDTANWTEGNGGSLTGQLGSEWMNWLIEKGPNITFTLNLTDNTTVTCTQTLSN